MASNCSWVFKALFFGFACCVQEKGATVLVRGWERGFDSAKRWSLCMLPSLSAVSSVFSSSCSSVCLSGAGDRAGHAKQDSILCCCQTAPLSAGDISLPTDVLLSSSCTCWLDGQKCAFFYSFTAALQKWQSCWMGLHHFSCFRKCLAGCVWQPVLVLGHGERGNCFGVPGQHGIPTMAVTLPQVHCA